MNEKPKSKEPMEAILVRVIKNKDKMDEKVTKLKTITRIAVPQGPMRVGNQIW